MSDPQTHSPTCYREHHACAVARLDRLREQLLVAIKVWGAIGREERVAGETLDLLVAVRDITEGR